MGRFWTRKVLSAFISGHDFLWTSAMPFVARVPFAKTSRPPVEITYRAIPCPGKQARFAGREMFVPEIDLAQWTCRAVVDWLDVKGTFGRRTQPQHVQKVLCESFREDRVTHVAPLNSGPDRTSETFVIRYQEPNRRRFSKAMTALEKKFGILGERTTAIEVSVDFKPEQPSDEARAQMFGVLQRALWIEPSVFDEPEARPRTSTARGKPPGFMLAKIEGRSDGKAEWLSGERDAPVPADSTLYVGRRDGDVLLRLMDKVIDRQDPGKGMFDPLKDEDKRVRIEVTLRGSALDRIGLQVPDDLGRVKFSQLQSEVFKMVLPTFPGARDPEESVADSARTKRARDRFLAAGVLALQAMEIGRRAFREQQAEDVQRFVKLRGLPVKKRDRRGTGETSHFVSYAALNSRLRKALENLERSWAIVTTAPRT